MLRRSISYDLVESQLPEPFLVDRVIDDDPGARSDPRGQRMKDLSKAFRLKREEELIISILKQPGARLRRTGVWALPLLVPGSVALRRKRPVERSQAPMTSTRT